MNPIDFFDKKGGFPFNAIPDSQINPESIYEMKKMVKQYHALLNDDFWGDIHGLRTSRSKKGQIIPVEIWENEENLFLLIIVPGLPNMNHAKIHFNNNQTLTLKVKARSLKPHNGVTLLTNELPQHSYEREIFLHRSVNTSDYTSSYENGVLTYTFTKMNDELEIPFDF